MTKDETPTNMQKFLTLVTEIDNIKFRLDDFLEDLRDALKDDEVGSEIVSEFIDERMPELDFIGNVVQEKLANWVKENA